LIGPSNTEEIKVLINLGCSSSQARVYLTLTKIGPATIQLISKAAGIHRENLYKIVQSMIIKGLIEKEIGVPTKYRAVPPEDVLNLLVTHKQTQIAQLEKQAYRFIETLNKIKADETAIKSINSEFMTISGRNSIIKRSHNSFENTKKCISIVTNQKRFSRSIVEFSEDYERALTRGVKIRLAIEKHLPEKTSLKIIEKLSRNPNFQVRYVLKPNQAIVVLFDEKEAQISLSATASLSGAESLWSNNSCLIAIVKAYFEQTWENSCMFAFPLKEELNLVEN
jgi:sugar-specific transcriptional regulator TrmB